MNRIRTGIALILGLCGVLPTAAADSTQLVSGKWHGGLQRKDGVVIPFEMEIQITGAHSAACYLLNGQERIRLEQPELTADSLILPLPVYGTWLRLKRIRPDSVAGVWVSGTEAMALVHARTASGKHNAALGAGSNAVAGRWAITFTRPNNTTRPAIGIFNPSGAAISGSVLTPSGDYRYLNGTLTGDSLVLHTFDGAHALLLTARLVNGQLAGVFYAGAQGRETWVAVQNSDAALTPPPAALQPGSDSVLHFSFRDLEGNPVSLEDERFRNRAVLIQVMGSWCPNCMDETVLLTSLYNRYKSLGVEMVALAYELSTNKERSVASLRKFQQRFQVPYPILNTGATAGDAERTAKTLPQLTPLKVFPTTILLDKKHRVQYIKSGFYGPAAGSYHVQYKQQLEQAVVQLIQ